MTGIGRGGLVLVVLLAGCNRAAVQPGMQPAPAGVTPAGAAAALPGSVQWTRSSAEHDALFRQTYRFAGERIRTLSSGRAPGTWGVIMDADETLLDNSEYQRDRARAGGGFDAASWTAWVKREAATALPGALDFIRTVHDMGGHLAVVTNREDDVCPETRANLQAVGIAADVVLCHAPGPTDKSPRFLAVEHGTAASGVPAFDVLMWVGDNIQDFPDLSQDIRGRGDAAFAAFGSRFIVLPNPMYGSWERNPAR